MHIVVVTLLCSQLEPLSHPQNDPDTQAPTPLRRRPKTCDVTPDRRVILTVLCNNRMSPVLASRHLIQP